MGISPTSPIVSTGAKKSQLFYYGFIFQNETFMPWASYRFSGSSHAPDVFEKKKAIITFYSLYKLFLNFFWRLFVKLLVTQTDSRLWLTMQP